MKSRVLARVTDRDGAFVAEALCREHTWITGRGSGSVAAALESLREELGRAVDNQGREWVKSHSGSANAPNCPEGVIKLPIDVWACKIVQQTCPLQAQVLLDEPEEFFAHCLASPERKQDILATVRSGKYGGFHHVPGRYLCAWCDKEGRAQNFRYHYPWEVTSVDAYYAWDVDRDWPHLFRLLRPHKLGSNVLTSFLCAPHNIELAKIIDSNLAAQLHVIELDFYPR